MMLSLLLRVLCTQLLVTAFLCGFAPSVAAEEILVKGDDEARLTQMMGDGSRLLSQGKPGEALEVFYRVAKAYEEKFRGEKARLYAARSQVESLMYMVTAATENKGDAKVVSAAWPYAYYFQAYALVEMQRTSEAKPLLEKAINMSPRNSLFLSELGHIYQSERNWPLALQSFRAAEAAAREFSPPELKNAELSRAWRGVGFALIEQNKFDEAEKIYRQCLDLNPNDSKALNELRYIESLRAKQNTQ